MPLFIPFSGIYNYSFLAMQEKSINIVTKYQHLQSPEELKLLSYDSLIENNQFDFVYKPNDDTYLMLSTLRQQINNFGKDLFLCQLGSGSGIISANLNNWMKGEDKQPLVHISIDINMDASLLSKKYYDKYNLNITQINASLFNSFVFGGETQQPKPDIVIFNPPYVPVEQQEIDNQKKYLVEKLRYVREKKQSLRQREQNMIAYSYMGGLDGLTVTRKILKQLSWSCIFYFIVMGQEGLDQITKEINNQTALHPNSKFNKELTVMQYGHFYNEHLFVLKLNLQRI